MITLPPLYPILDAAILARRGVPPSDAASALLDAGCRILQFRHKGPFGRAVFQTAEDIAAQCRAADALFVVNDRADIALMVRAGVHVGQDDLPVAAARTIVGPEAVIGVSTHNEAQLRASATDPANYVAIGPIFGTASKENPDPVVGLDELRRLRTIESRPLVAIGGITAANAAEVRDAGADSVAVIGALYPDTCTVADIRRAAAILLARVSGQ